MAGAAKSGASRTKQKAPTEGGAKSERWISRSGLHRPGQCKFNSALWLICDALKMKRDAAVHSGSRLRSHPLPVLTKLSPFTQRSPMGSMVIESRGMSQAVRDFLTPIAYGAMGPVGPLVATFTNIVLK
jgi:hypothetical protein